MSQMPNLRLTSRNSAVFLERMNNCITEAKAASLPRVRERSLRAAAAWQEMYEKAHQFERLQGR